MKIETARHVIRWFLRRTGYGAITAPWQTVYVLPERIEDSGLIRHELVHVEQIQRLGAWRWTWQYLWGLLRYGYRNNPLEVEARKKSGAALAEARYRCTVFLAVCALPAGVSIGAIAQAAPQTISTGVAQW